ncbi:MAG TPA: membrane dipeptidase, partial [Gaiellaceae bacterium]|nr:membrane dipeptidase [Gaiellaceae bacterium]
MRRANTIRIADGHSDLLQELVFAEQQGEDNPFRTRWLEQLQDGGVVLQICAVYQPPQADARTAFRQVLRQVASFHATVESNPEVSAVNGRREVGELDSGGLGLLLAIEGVSSFGEDIWPVDLLARLGVRVLAPTWNEQNAFASGCDHDGGLTELGRRLIDRVPTLGMVIDLAHASPQTMTDVLERAPAGAVFVSHASCRAVHDHRRNLSDAQLTGIAERGGVVCLMPHPLVVGPSEPTIDRFVDHIDHAVSVMGVDRVGLGGDFLKQIARATGLGQRSQDGVEIEATVQGLEGPRDYPRLLEVLRARGYS